MDPLFSGSLAEALANASAFLQQEGQNPGLVQSAWLDFKDWTLNDLVNHLQEPCQTFAWPDFCRVLEGLSQGQPLQYLLGRANFRGTWYQVSLATLIPREETGGLIDLAIKFFGDSAPTQILDIGTGTGILAIELAKVFPQAQVVASDISEEALKIARVNAETMAIHVDFFLSDVCKTVPKKKYQLIVSNPPYIALDELDLMDPSVINYEPHLALFADQEGLAIYQKLAQELPAFIDKQGLILLEIGFRQGQKVAAIFKEAFPQAEITIHKDFYDKDRFVQIKI